MVVNREVSSTKKSNNRSAKFNDFPPVAESQSRTIGLGSTWLGLTPQSFTRTTVAKAIIQAHLRLQPFHSSKNFVEVVKNW